MMTLGSTQIHQEDLLVSVKSLTHLATPSTIGSLMKRTLGLLPSSLRLLIVSIGTTLIIAAMAQTTMSKYRLLLMLCLLAVGK
ncbi:hypothetical protein ES703_00329 [subsurface metagenome]